LAGWARSAHDPPRKGKGGAMGFLSNFWDFLWMFLTVFVFLVYLFAILAIMSDLFRDHTLTGWAKALWTIGLIAVPFVTALVYLIVRGSGMAERQQAAVEAAQLQANAYIRSVASSSPAKEIQKAKSLLDSGVISADEFRAIKAQVTRVDAPAPAANQPEASEAPESNPAEPSPADSTVGSNDDASESTEHQNEHANLQQHEPYEHHEHEQSDHDGVARPHGNE
ncbi:MAG: SHOCT domain-containing protein, partial [Agromyces sp.]